MAMATASNPPATRRFTADEVWKMVEIGLLGPDEPYELLDGELQYVSPGDPPHAKVVNRITMAFVPIYGLLGAVVRVQHPVGGIRDSIPEPDVAIVPRDVEEGASHPHPDQAILIIEVAHTSLRRDLRKGAIYAAAGTPEYWIVDVERDAVTVHAGPRPDGTWERVTDVAVDGELTLPRTEATMPVAAILRPAA